MFPPFQVQSNPPEGQERRNSVRHLLGTRSCYALLAALGDKVYPAQVHDVSAEGIGLLVGRSYPPGSLLTAHVTCPGGALLPTLLVRVVHATPQPDGRYLVGGVLLRPLTDAELQQLLH